METMPSTSSSPVNLNSAAGGCSKTRKSFLIDSLLDSILERKKACLKFGLRNNSNLDESSAVNIEEDFEREKQKCEVENGDENMSKMVLNSSTNCLPFPRELDQANPLPSSMDDSSGAPPSDPSPSTPNNHFPATSKSNFFPPTSTAFMSLFNRFAGFPKISQDITSFNPHQQQLEHLHRLRVLQSSFGLGTINNQEAISNLQKSALAQQQVLATTALRHRMAAAMAQQAAFSSVSKIELAHKKLLSKQLGHKPTAVATSLEAFRAALAASSLVATRSGGKLGGKGKGVRMSPPSAPSTSDNTTKFVGRLNGRREGGRRPNGSAARSSNAKKYRCDICEKTFSRSNTLITHKRIHTGEKPFQCEHCGRAFRQPGNLTRHAYTHTTVKPFVCGECGKAFNRASNLQTHQRVHSQQSISEDI